MNQGNSLISIIIPVYNVEKYLDRCMNSIVNQTYKNLEIILVDDGSPDNCPEMCDDWAEKDNRIKVVHKKNGGLSSARNIGIELSKGDYIGFVDSDDWISLDMYSVLYNLIIAYDADISGGRILKVKNENIDEDKNRKSCDIIEYSQEKFAYKYFKINSNETVHYVVDKLYKSKIAKQIRFPEGLINEDVEGFFLGLINASNIVLTNQVVYYYWENVNGISYKWFSRKQMDLLKVWENVCVICKETKPEWIYLAELNYKRAHLGLLTRLMLNSSQEDSLYEEEKDYLLCKLKQYSSCLLKSTIPNSRKLLLILMCFNYNATRKIFRMIKFDVYNIDRKG